MPARDGEVDRGMPVQNDHQYHNLGPWCSITLYQRPARPDTTRKICALWHDNACKPTGKELHVLPLVLQA
jgi:hypothetical protein